MWKHATVYVLCKVVVFFDSIVSPAYPQMRGRTPLHRAVIWDQVEVVELLLKLGANPNAEDHDVRTSWDGSAAEEEHEHSP